MPQQQYRRRQRSYAEQQAYLKSLLNPRTGPGAGPRPGKKSKSGDHAKIIACIIAAVVLFGGGGGAAVVHHEATTPAGGKPSTVALQILAQAKTYDKEHYVFGGTGGPGSGGHPPSKYSWGKGLDCSGLIDVSVLKVTGISEDNVAASFRNSKHWKSIKKKDVRAGDIMYIIRAPGETDHVVIVESNKGDGKLNVFAARTANDDWADQIRGSTGQHYKLYTGALRWNG